MKKRISIAILVLSTFLATRYLKYFYGYLIFGVERWNQLDKTFANNLLVYTQMVLLLVVSVLLFKKKTLTILGLSQGIKTGLIIGALCSLPMFIGYGVLNGFELNIEFSLIHRDVVLAGFFEELLFRGFLFGILYFVAGWGFIPAVVIPSIFFGLGHVYQAANFNEVISVFLFTMLGSAGFAWFYTAWRNLWVLVFLHAFMDLAWDLFQIETNVTGNLEVNLFRFASLGLMIYLSYRNLKQNPAFSIKGSWWVNRTVFPH